MKLPRPNLGRAAGMFAVPTGLQKQSKNTYGQKSIWQGSEEPTLCRILVGYLAEYMPYKPTVILNHLWHQPQRIWCFKLCLQVGCYWTCACTLYLWSTSKPSVVANLLWVQCWKPSSSFIHLVSFCGLWVFSVVAMSKTCLEGVASEWEGSSEIRARIRNYKPFLSPALLHPKAVANIRCGEQNFDVLAPLAKRLLVGENEVGMHVVPDIKKENLNQLMPKISC